MKEIMKNKRWIFPWIMDITMDVFFIGMGVYLFSLIFKEFPYEFWLDYLFYQAAFFFAWGMIDLTMNIIQIVKTRKLI